MKPRWKLTLVDQACCLQGPQCTTKLGPEDPPNDECNSKMTGIISSWAHTNTHMHVYTHTHNNNNNKNLSKELGTKWSNR